MIPEGVKYIPQFAFLQCDNLEVLRARDIRLVLECACYMCKKLKEVHFTTSLEVVQGQSFFMCGELEKIYIHNKDNYDIVETVIDINTIPQNKTYNRFLQYQLVSNAPLLFTINKETTVDDVKPLVSLFTINNVEYMAEDPEP